MIRCTTCGSENKDNAPYCISCGGRVSSAQNTKHASPVKCYSCFFVNPPNTAMCKKCGKSLIPEIRNLSRQDNYTANRLVGIGGWLIVVVIGLCLSILISGLTTVGILFLRSSVTFTADSDFTLNLLLALSVVSTILPIIGLILMVSKKKEFRSLMIGMQIISFGSALINLYASDIGRYSTNFNNYVAIIASIAWLAYFLKSERVRNTFVN
jgi:hypothetical protein